MTRWTRITALTVLTAWLALDANAQRGNFGRGLPPDTEAQATKKALEAVLKNYPPSLTQVLQLDPSLLSNAAYLAPYPKVVQFVKDNPVVTHNTAYFLGTVKPPASPPKQTVIYQTANRGFDSLAYYAVTLSLFGAVAWLIHSAMEQRRALQISRSRMETQMKILERFTSNEDLLNFIQTPAGKNFLESASMPAPPRVVSVPANQILRSSQIGIVLIAAGIGFQYMKEYADFRALRGLGFLAVAVGVGFVLSALSSYVLSRKLGLLNSDNVTSQTPSS
jgi:hypothetical protein